MVKYSDTHIKGTPMLLLFLIPIITVFAFTFCHTYFTAHNLNKANIKKAEPLTPANTIILFDLHGVVFKHDYKKMLATFWHSPQKWSLMKDMLDPCLIWDMLKLLYRRPIPESFFMHLAHDYKKVKDVLPLLVRIANCQRVNWPIVALIKQLKKQGYECALLSNIGQRIYLDLQPHHKDVFHLFDHIMVATPETHYISKPNPKIYERFIKEINIHNKHIVMIDDKHKNLRGGLLFGIIGILFTNTSELSKKLTSLGIQLHTNNSF